MMNASDIHIGGKYKPRQRTSNDAYVYRVISIQRTGWYDDDAFTPLLVNYDAYMPDATIIPCQRGLEQFAADVVPAMDPVRKIHNPEPEMWDFIKI